MSWLDDLFGSSKAPQPLTVNVNHHIVHDVRVTLTYEGGDLNDLKEFIMVQTQAMQEALAELRAAVDANTQVDQSAITLINGLADKIDELSGNPEALKELAAELRAKNAALAEAVQAHTAAAPNLDDNPPTPTEETPTAPPAPPAEEPIT
jgi:septal ring factor EnvC (AmiA/AmiB activator)